MSKVCTIESGGLEATLRVFSPDARGKALFTALTAGAKALQAETVSQLIAKMGAGATRRGLKGRPQYADHSPMTEGVRLMRKRAFIEAGVHIMGDFRLKWFELGTVERYAGGRKKNGLFPGRMNASNYRGAIKGLGFFQEARSNDAPVIKAIEQTLEKQLKKLLK